MELKQSHWNTVYSTKQAPEVSWMQEKPKTSLDFIHSFQVPRTAKIIDISGGDSKLVDYLLEEGFENITVLDISEKALDRAKARLGKKTLKVQWNSIYKIVTVYAFLGWIAFNSANAQQQKLTIKNIKIEGVSFLISTVSNVSCDRFYSMFDRQNIKNIEIKVGSADYGKFMSLCKNFKPSRTHHEIDARVHICYYIDDMEK